MQHEFWFIVLVECDWWKKKAFNEDYFYEKSFNQNGNKWNKLVIQLIQIIVIQTKQSSLSQQWISFKSCVIEQY